MSAESDGCAYAAVATVVAVPIIGVGLYLNRDTDQLRDIRAEYYDKVQPAAEQLVSEITPGTPFRLKVEVFQKRKWRTVVTESEQNDHADEKALGKLGYQQKFDSFTARLADELKAVDPGGKGLEQVKVELKIGGQGLRKSGNSWQEYTATRTASSAALEANSR